MEIRPATIAMLGKARNGRMVSIADDVQGVANGLARIDPHIRLRFSEAGGYYVIYWTSDPSVSEEEVDKQGDDYVSYLIFTAQDLDARIVTEMEKTYHECQQPGYSFADELNKKDAKHKKDKEHAFTEKHGEMYERLAHGMRRDLGYNQSRVYVTKDIDA